MGSHIFRLLSCPTLNISTFSQVIASFLVEVYNQIDGYLWILSINPLELEIMIILNVFLLMKIPYPIAYNETFLEFLFINHISEDTRILC